MAYLVTLNAGSSSIKAALYKSVGPDEALPFEPILKVHLSGIGSHPRLSVSEGDDGRDTEEADVTSHERAWACVMTALQDFIGGETVQAVGHRVVHGGRRYSEPVIVTEAIKTELQSFISLAPLHEPYNLMGIAAAEAAWPDAVQIACFDTAFHRHQPETLQRFAIPRHYFDQGVLRYGFHGLSYDFINRQIPKVLGAHAHDKVIVAHLGAGASMCAIKEGQSLASTMGFTALAGLPMATRCGDIDPGLLLHWIEHEGEDPKVVAHRLHKESGLLGLSGLSGDMRVLEASDQPAAQEAIAVFVERCLHEIGALTATMGGLDALIFTAGVGEHSAHVRGEILQRLTWLGFEYDQDRNARHDSLITKPESKSSAWVIPTNEEWVIAFYANRLSELNALKW